MGLAVISRGGLVALSTSVVVRITTAPTSSGLSLIAVTAAVVAASAAVSLVATFIIHFVSVVIVVIVVAVIVSVSVLVSPALLVVAIVAVQSRFNVQHAINH